MAVFEFWMQNDLQKPLNPVYINGAMFTKDNEGYRVGVEVTNNGASETLVGNVIGNIIIPNGETVPVTGSKSGNKASILVPQAALLMEGQIVIVIKLTNSGTVTTLGCLVVTVRVGETDTIIDPGTILPSIADLEERIADAVATIPVDYTDLENAVGVYDYAAEAKKDSQTAGGVTYTYLGNFTWQVTTDTISGTPSYELIQETTFEKFHAGQKLYILFESTSSATFLQTYKYVNGTWIFDANDVSGWYTIPSDATGILIRARTNAQMDGTFKFNAYRDSSAMEMLTSIQDVEAELDEKLGFVKVLTSTDNMDNYAETGAFCYTQSSKPVNAPEENSNAVVTIIHGYSGAGFTVQYVSTNSGKMYQRTQFTNGTWTNWVSVGNGAGSGTTIQNTYNIETSPTITTDSNGWLQAVDTDTASETGKTDMTGAIMSMLNDTGYCHLGEGIFYVSGSIDMPDGSTLCGCGNKSEIRLLQSTATGYCVKMQKHNTVKDVAFSGSHTDISPSSEGTRTAILFAANYDGQTDGNTQVQTEQCMMSDIWITNFSGSGIKCHNTSVNYSKGLYALNIQISNCWAGLNIDYYSEFNKFVNVCTSWCYYGCINNGGNNVFTSCTFHASNTGFYIDGTQPNSAHGTINGCTFCHTGSNLGSALTINNATNGFIISNCQFWYNSINISGSSGIAFDGCEFGRCVKVVDGVNIFTGMIINISGGNTVLFSGCMFMLDGTYTPEITKTSNTKTKFSGCFGSETGNEISV